MKYIRSKLLAAALAAVKEDEQRHQLAHKQAVDKWQGEHDKWAATYSESWVAAGRRIAAKARKGQPITYGDLVNRIDLGPHYPALFDATQPKLGVYRTPFELRVLMAALEAIADDVVTSAGLRELGVTGPTIRQALRFMEPGSVVN